MILLKILFLEICRSSQKIQSQPNLYCFKCSTLKTWTQMYENIQDPKIELFLYVNVNSILKVEIE
jgi:hypothetical protein